ncbi:hypothetical protein LINGRAPRIM_LOCUS1031, partial [Linum grandiflorum]
MDNLSKIEELQNLNLTNKVTEDSDSRSPLSLAQRLQGWAIELRFRQSGQCDTFFYHEGVKFRSIIGATEFILRNDLRKKRKDTLPAKNKRSVEDFLKEAFDNMMNNKGDPAYCEFSIQNKKKL